MHGSRPALQFGAGRCTSLGYAGAWVPPPPLQVHSASCPRGVPASVYKERCVEAPGMHHNTDIHLRG